MVYSPSAVTHAGRLWLYLEKSEQFEAIKQRLGGDEMWKVAHELQQVSTVHHTKIDCSVLSRKSEMGCQLKWFLAMMHELSANIRQRNMVNEFMAWNIILKLILRDLMPKEQ